MNSLNTSSGLGLLLIGLLIFAVGMAMVKSKIIVLKILGIVFAVGGLIMSASAIGINAGGSLVIFLVALLLIAIGSSMFRSNRLLGGVLALLGVLIVVGLDSIPQVDGLPDSVATAWNSGVNAIQSVIPTATRGFERIFGK